MCLFLNSVPLSDNNVLGLSAGNAMSFSAASTVTAVLSPIGLTHAYRVKWSTAINTYRSPDSDSGKHSKSIPTISNSLVGVILPLILDDRGTSFERERRWILIAFDREVLSLWRENGGETGKIEQNF
jgi:hypothetical protein